MFELMPMNHRMPVPYRAAREFDDFFPQSFRSAMNAFSTDIVDAGDFVELRAELPGFKKEDIKISVENDLLTISGERKQEESEEKPHFIRQERFYGSFSRSFDLTGIDVEKISAAYTDGILSLKLPKLPEKLPASKQIQIS